MKFIDKFIKYLEGKSVEHEVSNKHEVINSTNDSKDKISKEGVVYSPFTGKAIELNQVEDEVFASESMGKGFAVMPSDGTIFAPFDGKVITVFPTKHAIVLVSEDGIELLIHIGMDTVELQGKPFDIKISNGGNFKKGDILGQVDLKYIKDAGYQTVTPVIVTNINDYSNIDMAKLDNVNNDDICIRLI